MDGERWLTPPSKINLKIFLLGIWSVALILGAAWNFLIVPTPDEGFMEIDVEPSPFVLDEEPIPILMDEVPIPLPCPAGTIIFQDHFDYSLSSNGLTDYGWVSVTRAGAQLTQPVVVAEGFAALKLTDTSSRSGHKYIHSIPPQSGKFEVDYYLRADDYGQGVHFALIGSEGVVEPVRGRGIVAELSDNFPKKFRVQHEPYFTYNLKQWYHVRLVINVPERNFDVYVDDMVTPLLVNVGFNDSYFDKIQIGTGMRGTGTGYWDSIVVRGDPGC